ncbi:MAG: hypothetical protein V4725_08060 [Bacteroidota bacterium]
MTHFKPGAFLLVATTSLFLYGCNNATTPPQTKESDTASATTMTENTPTMPAYDPAMDALNVGGDMNKKLVDSLGVKMYEFSIKLGQSWSVHTHPDHTVYVLQGGKMALYMEQAGRLDTLTFATGMGFVSGPLTDSGRNIGNTTIKMVVTDIYRPRGK